MNKNSVRLSPAFLAAQTQLSAILERRAEKRCTEARGATVSGAARPLALPDGNHGEYVSDSPRVPQ